MELVFQEKQLDYLGRVLDQTVTQELTAEVIVPDSCADADRVVDAFGTLLVRAEECTAGSASVSGEVQAGILFVTEDGRLERLETVIPFSARRGWEGEQSDCRLQCVCRLCSVDARLVHSRKLLVRVGVSCTLTVYAAFTRTLHDFPEPAPTLQLRRKRLPLRLPRGLGEKSFSLNEEIEIPASKPPVERLLKCVYALDTAGVPLGALGTLACRLPLYSVGFGWVCAAAVMLCISICMALLRRRMRSTAELS